MAAFDPNQRQWSDISDFIVDKLLGQPELLIPLWWESLEPVKHRLLEPLLQRHRNNSRSLGSVALTSLLADLLAGDEEQVVELIRRGRRNAVGVPVPILQQHRKRVILLLQELAGETVSAEWPTTDVAVSSSRRDSDVTDTLLNAKGLLTQHFALVQALPLAKLKELTDKLATSGYRLRRVRPYGPVSNVMVAAIWDATAVAMNVTDRSDQEMPQKSK